MGFAERNSDSKGRFSVADHVKFVVALCKNLV